MHGKAQPRRTLKKYTVNRNMLSELYIVKIDCHILENSLRSVKVLKAYRVNIWKNLISMHQINSNTVPTNLKSPLTIAQQTLLELIIVYHVLN